MIDPSPLSANILSHTGGLQDAAMIELQLGTSTIGGRTPYLIRHIERISGLVETALYVQVSSSISTDDTAEVGKSVCVRKLFVFNLDWSCVGSFQCHNFSLLAADVQANLLCKGVEAMRLLLYVGVGV